MRKKRFVNSGGPADQTTALLLALSDDLALPFMQIKSTSELLKQVKFSEKKTALAAEQMLLSADNGLQLVEAYRLVLLSNELNQQQLEPVAIGAILQDVAHQLTPYAKLYATDLEVDIQGRPGPVLAHQPSLSAALQVISTSLIRAQSAQRRQPKYRLLLGAHRTPQNLISAGVFSNVQGLSDRALRTARSLVGRARQPLPAIPPGTASGILIADMLCSAMWQPLRAAAHKNMTGLATTIPLSNQLQFV